VNRHDLIGGTPAPSAPEATTTSQPTGTHESSHAGRSLERWKNAGLSGPTRVLLPLALGVGVIFGMKYAASFLNPVLLAFFLTMGVSPALDWMRRKGIPAWLSAIIVAMATVALIVAFVTILVTAVGQFNAKLPFYEGRLGNVLSDAQAWFSRHGIDITALTKQTVTPSRIFGLLGSFLSSFVSAAGSLFWLILTFLFMVAESYAIPSKIRGGHLDDRLARSFTNFSQVTRSFLFTKGWLSAIMAFLTGIIYWVFGVDFALVWAVLFFLLSFVPNVGFILSVIPPFAVTVLEFGWIKAIVVIGVVLVANAIVDNMISPRVMGRTVGLSTLTVFISVFFWGWVLGGIGALMSVPLTLMVKLLFFDSFDSTRLISDIMGTPVRELGKRRWRSRLRRSQATEH
jgi:AI-2 transport protein TqsA